MENLNAEQVKRALECCIEGTSEACLKCSFGLTPPYPVCKTMIHKRALAIIKSQEKRIKKLTEEAEGLKQCMEHEHASFMETFGELDDECKRLTEENDKLHASCTELARVQEENERLERICESYALQYGTATDKEVFLKEERADTVRKMHSEIKERCIKGGIYPAFVASTIDQIAKEMLEGDDENQ